MRLAAEILQKEKTIMNRQPDEEDTMVNADTPNTSVVTTTELPEETVIGSSDRDSTMGQKRRDIHVAALDARAKQDLDGVFAAYRSAVEERTEIENLWMTSMGHFVGDAKKKLDVGPVEAIRDVALAAIALAEKLASGTTTTRTDNIEPRHIT